MGIRGIGELIAREIPGTHVHSVMLGSNPAEDAYRGFVGDVNAQVESQCETLALDARLAGGFHAIGFSQGGQFLRALAQRCGDRLNVRSLITLGGQHQGVAAPPRCGGDATAAAAAAEEEEEEDDGEEEEDDGASSASVGALCRAMTDAIARGAYARFTRDRIVQAQYFKDANDLASYRKHNPFLPDVNNELVDDGGEETRNETYRRNLLRLEKLVLFKWTDDTVVVPRESSWFGTYAENDRGGAIVPLREQRMYAEDWLGLRALDEAGRLKLLEIPGDHMTFTREWFVTNVIDAHLREGGGFKGAAGRGWLGGGPWRGGVRAFARWLRGATTRRRDDDDDDDDDDAYGIE